jgi:hypothetical protein
VTCKAAIVAVENTAWPLLVVMYDLTAHALPFPVAHRFGPQTLPNRFVHGLNRLSTDENGAEFMAPIKRG